MVSRAWQCCGSWWKAGASPFLFGLQPPVSPTFSSTFFAPSFSMIILCLEGCHGMSEKYGSLKRAPPFPSCTRIFYLFNTAHISYSAKFTRTHPSVRPTEPRQLGGGCTLGERTGSVAWFC